MPKSAQPGVATLVRTIFNQVDEATVAEQTDEWAERHRYIGPELLARSRMHLLPGEDTTTELKEIMATETTTA